jgi:hypothetical protein
VRAAGSPSVIEEVLLRSAGFAALGAGTWGFDKTVTGCFHAPWRKERTLIVLGVILLLIGFIAKISILWTIGIILLVVGAVLAIIGGTGRMVGGRKHWF